VALIAHLCRRAQRNEVRFAAMQVGQHPYVADVGDEIEFEGAVDTQPASQVARQNHPGFGSAHLHQRSAFPGPCHLADQHFLIEG
jgi:hypothetical protein